MRWAFFVMAVAMLFPASSWSQQNDQELSASMAKKLPVVNGMIELPRGVTSLSLGAAQELAGSTASILWLKTLTRLDREVAEALAGFRGTLYLDGLKTVTLEEAKVLASHKGALSVTGLEDLEPEVVSAISVHRAITMDYTKIRKPDPVRLPPVADRSKDQSSATSQPNKGGSRGAREITLNHIEVFGAELVGKRVFVRDCKFCRISDDVSFVPGVQVSTNGLISEINVREKDRWVKIECGDSSDPLFFYCYASKEPWAHFFISFKYGDRFDCEGLVTELNGTGGSKGLWILKATRQEKDK